MLVKETLSRKEQIELEATELFKSRGYSATSMRDLAQVLGIEAASLYSHIKSKEELLQKICFRIANRFMSNIDEVLTMDLEPGDRLTEAIQRHVSVITEDISASAVFWTEWRHLSSPYLEDFVSMKESYEDKLKNIIVQGIGSGEFKDLNPTVSAMAILTSLNGIHLWYKASGELSPEQLAEKISEIIQFGIHK